MFRFQLLLFLDYFLPPFALLINDSQTLPPKFEDLSKDKKLNVIIIEITITNMSKFKVM